MPQFMARMRVTYQGVEVFVEADNAAEAESMFNKMAWTDLEIGGAEIVDWEIQGAVEENK